MKKVILIVTFALAAGAAWGDCDYAYFEGEWKEFTPSWMYLGTPAKSYWITRNRISAPEARLTGPESIICTDTQLTFYFGAQGLTMLLGRPAYLTEFEVEVIGFEEWRLGSDLQWATLGNRVLMRPIIENRFSAVMEVFCDAVTDAEKNCATLYESIAP